ncbi:MAG: hypothetical protein HC840_17335 [Leptolyngbyaceae cyanobacterium RM2_2_4]|nr:hypothetical protein [Leptolyngbyaceae cyanobacterium SM1_4_3]NJO50911.1 hypothetical protein [Leptolyngbyaceae cyanobacterium RM2_2_4]
MSSSLSGKITLSVPHFPGHRAPSDRWEDVHYNQGFLWVPGCIIFDGLTLSRTYWVEVRCAERFDPAPESLRIISVPFTIDDFAVQVMDDLGGGVTIHGFTNGNYQLVYEGRELTDQELAVMPQNELLEPFIVDDIVREYPELMRLTFIPVEELSDAQILKSDEGLSPPAELVLNRLDDFPEL